MNQRFDSSTGNGGLRSEIDTTRRRMDETIDALAARFSGRHLIDEALEYFRTRRGKGNDMKDKITESAGSALHAVADTVKAHPLPSMLIGAGVAWMIYERQHPDDGSGSSQGRNYAGGPVASYEGVDYEGADFEEDLYPGSAYAAYESESGVGEFGSSFRPERHSSETGSRSRTERAKQMAREKAEHARHRAGQVAQRAREGARTVKERTSDIASRAREPARHAYERSRETLQSHPLEAGVVCLALGAILGIAIRAPQKFEEVVGPTSERLQRRAADTARDVARRGKHVAEAATSAAREEAREQDLTPEALREKASAVAGEAKNAARETAREEGLDPERSREKSGEG